MIAIFQHPTSTNPVVTFSNTTETHCYCAVCDLAGNVQVELSAPFINGYAAFDLLSALPIEPPPLPTAWYGAMPDTTYRLMYGSVGGTTVLSDLYRHITGVGTLHDDSVGSAVYGTIDYMYYRPTSDQLVFNMLQVTKKDGTTVSIFNQWIPMPIELGNAYYFRCDLALLRIGLTGEVKDVASYEFRLYRNDRTLIGLRKFRVDYRHLMTTFLTVNEYGVLETLNVAGFIIQKHTKSSIVYTFQTTFITSETQTKLHRLLNNQNYIWKQGKWQPIRLNITELPFQQTNIPVTFEFEII